MIKELVEEFVLDNNIIITAPTGNGSTVLSLHIINLLLDKDKIIIIYNPNNDIDARYIRSTYPIIFKNVFFITGPLSLLLDFLDYINYDVDTLMIDPGDSLMSNYKIYPLIKSAMKKKNIIVTSQIRQDPTKGGHIYSPIEELNKKYNNTLFKYSIWIRNVTEEEQLFKARYIDIFENNRVGNNFTRRYLVRFDIKTGVIIE